MLGKLMETGFSLFCRQRPVVCVELCEVRLEVAGLDERLVLPQKKWGNASVELVSGDEDVTKRKIIEICEVHLVVGFARGPDAGNKVSGDCEMEEQINPEQVAEIR